MKTGQKIEKTQGGENAKTDKHVTYTSYADVNALSCPSFVQHRLEVLSSLHAAHKPSQLNSGSQAKFVIWSFHSHISFSSCSTGKVLSSQCFAPNCDQMLFLQSSACAKTQSHLPHLYQSHSLCLEFAYQIFDKKHQCLIHLEIPGRYCLALRQGIVGHCLDPHMGHELVGAI